MKEVVVMSGKGGTGKTSLTAAFANLAGRCAVTDCDVDAADLHLVLAHEVVERHEFADASIAVIDPRRCQQCGQCMDLCRFGAITLDPYGQFAVDRLACEGCGVCARWCPSGAIVMQQVVSGTWFQSKTRVGPMFHAQLTVGAENSGRLVELIRRRAREAAANSGIELVITDGPPGVGCPAISAVTGATYAVLVTEPTVSGIHDVERIAEVVNQLGVPAGVVVNQADLNPVASEQLVRWAERRQMDVLGSVPHDTLFVRAQMEGKSVVEYGGETAREVERIWRSVERRLRLSGDAASVGAG